MTVPDPMSEPRERPPWYLMILIMIVCVVMVIHLFWLFYLLLSLSGALHALDALIFLLSVLGYSALTFSYVIRAIRAEMIERYTQSLYYVLVSYALNAPIVWFLVTI